MLQRRIEGFDRKRGGMMFPSRKSADFIEQILAREFSCFSNRLTDNRFRQNRSAYECWRATVGQVMGRFNPAIDYDQVQTNAVAANGVGLISDGVGAWDLTHVAWMSQVIVKLGRVGHGLRTTLMNSKRHWKVFLFDLRYPLQWMACSRERAS